VETINIPVTFIICLVNFRGVHCRQVNEKFSAKHFVYQVSREQDTAPGSRVRYYTAACHTNHGVFAPNEIARFAGNTRIENKQRVQQMRLVKSDFSRFLYFILLNLTAGIALYRGERTAAVGSVIIAAVFLVFALATKSSAAENMFADSGSGIVDGNPGTAMISSESTAA
jgi:hypothetical protein